MSRKVDLHSLPDGLPVPEDDGAADQLNGNEVPHTVLQSTEGGQVNLAKAAANDGFLVVYVYPQTGVPGRALPDGWDSIPGARGCTPQSCAFRDHAADLRDLGATVLGISSQPLDEQTAFVDREHLPFPLLSDPEFQLADSLRLPTFEVAGVSYYRRLTFVAAAGRIVKVFYPVFPPQENASNVQAWLRQEAG